MHADSLKSAALLLLTLMAARVAPLSRAVAPDALSVAPVPVVAPARLHHRHGLKQRIHYIYLAVQMSL